MELKASDYDPITGLPIEQDYLEANLPDFLMESIKRIQADWERIDASGEDMDWSSNFCELQSNINIMETGGFLTSDQAWYLREKYLRMPKEGNT
ncbi:MAG: hypothetical protein LUC50_05870 [Ruminococcus sp.]|nr:hypothetical protein [Ruminococcus sp.]